MISSVNGSGVLDLTEMLDRVGGDNQLIQEIAAIFLDESPALLEEIRESVLARDARRLEHAAHSLKGSVSNFCAHPATAAALALEVIGRNGRMEEAPAALRTLEAEFEALLPALRSVAGH